MTASTTWVGDMTDKFPGCIRAQARGSNGLVLRKLKLPVHRADRQVADYQLTHLWFSVPVEQDGVIAAENVCRVLGSSVTYWTEDEIERWHNDLFSNVSLF